MQLVKLYHVDSKIISNFDVSLVSIGPHLIDEKCKIKATYPEHCTEMVKECLESNDNNIIMFNMKRYKGLDMLVDIKKQYKDKQIIVEDITCELAIRYLPKKEFE